MGKRVTKKYNWTKIRNEYVQGYISLQKLCDKYDIPYNTILTRCNKSKEGWRDLRKKYRQKLNEKTIEKSADKISDEIQEMKSKERKHVAILEQAALNLLVQDGQLKKNLNASDVASISVVLERCQRMKYKSYGISENVEIQGGKIELVIPKDFIPDCNLPDNEPSDK